MTNIWKCCHLRIKCLPANLLAALMWRWYLNSERVAFQLRVEDSREGEGDDEKRKSNAKSTRGWWERQKKAMIYKARKDRKRGGSEKGTGKKQKKENHIFRACPKRIKGEIPRSCLKPFYTKTQYFGPRSD